MIDFRYHLVSLVSVFIALAIGIILGAGPLKESIDTSLTSQVQGLRQEKDDLRAQLDTETTSVSQRDAFDTTVTQTLVGGQLTGRSVAVVTLPGSAGNVVDPLVNAIVAAGGKVTGRVSISSSWVDPTQSATRDKALNDLLLQLPAGTVAGSGETDERLDGLLADALVSTDAGTFGRSTPVATAVLKTLHDANLIGIKGQVSGLAGSALVLAPANPEVTGKVQASPSTNVDPAYISLASALDTVGGGAVVTGPPSSASDGGVLAAIRKDDTAHAAISTVDDGSTPMGVITAVLALREQLAGGVGDYGFVGGNTKRIPALAAVADASTTATKK